MSTQIKYKGKVVTTFDKGTITLHTTDSQFDGDLEISSNGGSGGGSSGAEGEKVQVYCAV